MKLNEAKISVNICLTGEYLFDQRRFYRTENRVYNQMKGEHRVSDLKFKLVGKRVYSKPSRRSADKYLIHSLAKESHFSKEKEELSPMNLVQFSEDNNYEKNQTIYKYSAIEDTRVSRFTHHQILMVQKNVLVLALLVIFFGMIKIEADVIYPDGDISRKVMWVLSCCTGMLILLVVLRKILILQLAMDQRIVYVRQNERKQCKSSFLKFLKDKYLVIELLLELVLILPHPCALFQGVTYSLYNQNEGANFDYSLNDLFSVLMMVKIYLVFRSLVAMTIYSSPRAIRLCSYNNIEHGFFFSLKCIQHEYPLLTASIFFAITTVIFSFGFRVTEGNLHYMNPATLPDKTGFEDYGNCLWFTFITMTTIGFGEYRLITTMGRFLAVIVSIFGVMVNSFIVVALSQYLKMKTGQIRSHTTLERLSKQAKLYGQSAGVLAETIEVTQLLSDHKLDPLLLRKLKPIFDDLKKKMDSTKAKNREIKTILPQQNKTELMIHEFELVKDSFKEFYMKQRKIKEKIEKVEVFKSSQLKKVRLSFLKQIQSLFHKSSK